MTMAYADPPYPGHAALYRDEQEYQGEVDHRELIASLSATYDGWALSTSAEALRDILPLCPREAWIGSWVKPIGVSSKTFGKHNTWEPLIVVSGRALRPGFRDWLSAQPARHGGILPGRKPIAFCAWLFQCLGLCTGDTLVDLYPGTGIVGRTWREISSRRSELERADIQSVASVPQRHVVKDLDDVSPTPASTTNVIAKRKGTQC